ncbi:hypothetical protein D3C80_680080 [compost metagenome]
MRLKTLVEINGDTNVVFVCGNQGCSFIAGVVKPESFSSVHLVNGNAQLAQGVNRAVSATGVQYENTVCIFYVFVPVSNVLNFV